MDQFTRLYQGDNSRLMVADTRGRTAAHFAASKNRINVLQYIHAQQGSEYFRKLNTFIIENLFHPIQLHLYMISFD